MQETHFLIAILSKQRSSQHPLFACLVSETETAARLSSQYQCLLPFYFFLSATLIFWWGGRGVGTHIDAQLHTVPLQRGTAMWLILPSRMQSEDTVGSSRDRVDMCPFVLCLFYFFFSAWNVDTIVKIEYTVTMKDRPWESQTPWPWHPWTTNSLLPTVSLQISHYSLRKIKLPCLCHCCDDSSV